MDPECRGEFEKERLRMKERGGVLTGGHQPVLIEKLSVGLGEKMTWFSEQKKCGAARRLNILSSALNSFGLHIL